MDHSPNEQPRKHLSLAGGDAHLHHHTSPDASLQQTADLIRDSLSCEAVCILLWCESRQKLLTKYVSGLPTGLKGPEVYGPEEGLTGRHIFSQGRRLRCRIDFKSKTVREAEAGEVIADHTIKWQNMRAFRRRSEYKDFRSLMGAPVCAEREERGGRKRQRLGVVKLINKIKLDGGRKLLDERGFSERDEEALDSFLPAVESAIQGRRIAQYLESLGSINGKLMGTSFKYENVLKEVVRSCADVLNYRVCLVRRQQGARLRFEASNVGPVDDDYVSACDPSALAVREKIPVVWKATPGGGPALRLHSLDGQKTFSLASPSERALKMIEGYGVRSFLIEPILLRGSVIGTLECYTSQPHDFFEREVGAVGNYAGALAAALVYDKQQKLLKHLIEVQSTRGESGRQGNEETQLIAGTLEYIKEALGGEPTVLALLSAERLTNTMLDCETLYGVTPAQLRRVLRPEELETVRRGGEAALLNRPVSYTIRDDEGRNYNIYRAPFRLSKGAPPLGSLIVGAHEADTAKAFSKQVLSAEVKRLGMALSTIEKFRKSEALLEIVDEASRLEDLEEIYDFILKKTVSYFGFDYGVISRVNSVTRRVITERGKSVNPDVPSPEEWKHLSNYSLDHDRDILVRVVNEKKGFTIYGPTALKDYRGWLNIEIFRKYKHRDLIRVIIPFIFHQSVKSGDKFAHVLGVIEAGFHVNRQRQKQRIPRPLQKAFQFFINSCSKSLQRVTLLEQKNSEEAVLKKLDQEKNPNAILRLLLEESVKLVGGDSGDVTFLTHRDAKLRLLDDPIVYNIPKRRLSRLIKEQEVRAEGISISAKVAAEKKYYWTNDAKADPLYAVEFEEVESELCVPLLYSGQALGVLNINANRKNQFDERKAELIQSIANRAMGLYQKARVNDPLSTLVSPFNVFANSDHIYNTVIRLVEEFLGTETVSIWQKRPVKDDFELELAGASRALEKAYAEADIRKLKSDSFTGDAVGGEIVEVNSAKLRSRRFVYAHFAEDNGLEFMTAVPVSLGGEVYAVIDVFSRRPAPLFAEEKFFLRILASKAAIALQSAKLIYSFNEISAALPEGKIDSILQLITDSALEVLHANPVILYRYDAEQERFSPKPIISGWLRDESYRQKEAPVTENDLATKIRLSGTRYFKDKKEYDRFEREVKRKWQGTFNQPFWDREGIKSLAALRLTHGDDVVGVMFVNYRTRQSFAEHTRLIEAFASQATSAIVNAKLLEQNKRFWELRRRDSLALALSHVIPGLAHNSGNLLDSMTFEYLNFAESVEAAPGETVSKALCRGFLNDQQRLLKMLGADFRRLAYRKLDEFNEERCDVRDLIEGALRILRRRLEGVNVVWRKKKLPRILCDESQIQHMLLNLFLNSIAAMEGKERKELRIETAFDAQRQQVKIDITDNGRGVPPERRAELFEPAFSTRQSEGGSGYGLSTSRYIARNHDGSIEYVQPKDKVGATFSILLPVKRVRKNDRNDHDKGLRRRG